MHNFRMDNLEFDRLRKAIHRSFGSSLHRKKYWLALLGMYVEAEKRRTVVRNCS